MRFLLIPLLFSMNVFAQAPDLTALDIVERSVPDGPVALVNGAPVHREDFLRLYHEQLAMTARTKPDTKLEDSLRVKAGLAVLGELIQQEVLHQEAKARNIQLPDAEVAQAYQRQLQELQQEAKESGGAAPSEADVLQRIGKTKEEAMADLRRGLLIRQVREQIAKGQTKTSVTDADIQKFYQENAASFNRGGSIHLKQIYVRPKPNPEQATPEQWGAAQQRIEQALKRIYAGENFDAVARDISDAPDKTKGGNMEPQPAEKLPPFYVDVARQLKPGEISKVFKTAVGLHLIQLVAQEEGGKVSLEEAKPKIQTYLQHAKIDEAVDAYCQNIMTDPNRVKVFLQLDRTLAMLPELKGLAPAR